MCKDQIEGALAKEKNGIYHYTIVKYLHSILHSGEITLATAFSRKREKCAAWFSTNADWEETANKGTINMLGNFEGLTKEGTAKIGGGLARIEIDPEAAPYNWKYFKKKSGCKNRILKGLEKVALQDGANPKEWRVSFEPVTKDKWKNIEIYDFEQEKWITSIEHTEALNRQNN